MLSSTSMFKASAVNAGVSLILPEAVEDTRLKDSWVDIDIRKMSQVMRNLMSNALKFTPSGSSVTVAMRIVEQPFSTEKDVSLLDTLFPRRQTNYSSSNPWLEISVRDEGVGIEPQYLPRIFNEVLQINPNKNQGGKGTGMGLYISKGITELHGGRVDVHSDGLGHGSCFKVLLPLYLGQISSPSSTPKASIGALFTRKNSVKVSPCDGSDGQVKNNNETYHASDSEPPIMVQHDVNVISKSDHGSDGKNERQGGDDNLLVVVDSNHPQSIVVRSKSTKPEDHGPRDRGSADIAVALNTRTPYGHSFSTSVQKTTYSSTPNKDGEHQPRRITGNWLSNERLHGRKVLMVDDSLTNLKMCVKLLEKLGADVDKAEDGCIAVERIRASLSATVMEPLTSLPEHIEHLPTLQQPSPAENWSERSLPQEGRSRTPPPRMYDLVLMDNQMPNMTGAEACKVMREIGFAGIIIGLTGNAFEQDIADYIAQGANAVLKKPLVLADLFETLRQIDAANRV